MPLELQWAVDERVEGLEALLQRVCEACFSLEGVKNAGMTVRIASKEEVHALNREMRGVDRETDVLSFPTAAFRPDRTAGRDPASVRRQYDPSLGWCNLGDCVISLSRAREQAREYGHSLARELGYLTAHSAFHLMGYDHENENDRAAMRQMEERVMRRVSLARTEEDTMTDQQLFDLACEAMHRAYTPYSNFKVGACLLSSDGRTFQGCNIENASYGATICAERSAVSRAVMEGARSFTAIAVVGSSAQAWPCGICRQVLNEFSDGMRVICGQYGQDFDVVPLAELLPHSFGPEHLGVQEDSDGK